MIASVEERLELERDGAEHLAGAASACLRELEAATADVPIGRAGTRLRGVPELSALLKAEGMLGRHAAHRLGAGCRPVRALLFDKSVAKNWGLGWHQDRVIAVEKQIETPGFSSWTVKQGMTHVSPPFEFVAAMITIRVHLDDTGEDNAPLLIVPGSHRLGRIAEDRIESVVRTCGEVPCLAGAGDVWLYSTPILHASRPAFAPARRRVLQVDFAAFDLPGKLQWLGI